MGADTSCVFWVTWLSLSGWFSTHIRGRWIFEKPMLSSKPSGCSGWPGTTLITALQSVLWTHIRTNMNTTGRTWLQKKKSFSSFVFWTPQNLIGCRKHYISSTYCFKFATFAQIFICEQIFDFVCTKVFFQWKFELKVKRREKKCKNVFF